MQLSFRDFIGKRMSHSWLIRVRFSAAIALPSMSLLWLALPTKAIEEPQSVAASPPYAELNHELPPTAMSAHESQGFATDRAASAPASVAKPTARYEAVRPVASAEPASTENNTNTLANSETLAGMDVSSALKAALTHPQIEVPPQTDSVSNHHSIRWGMPLAPQTITAMPREVESTPADIRFSQLVTSEANDSKAPAADVAKAPAATQGLPNLVNSQPSESDSGLGGEASPQTEPSTIELLVLDSNDAASSAASATASLTEAAPSASAEESLSQAETNEPGDSPEDDSFSPLPDPSTEDPLPADETDADEADTVDEPEVDVTPSIPSTEAVPIPVERVLDNLEFLDPLPNPLLIQTQPEEVEIVGTQPLTLEETVELSYRNNPDLQTALLELEQTQEGLREARAALFPTVSLNSTLQGQNVTEQRGTSFDPTTGQTTGGGTFEELGASFTAQLDVVYNIFSSGQRDASIRAAEEQVRLQELEVERRREELRINTVNEYYDLQTAIESIRINDAFLEEAVRNLRDTSLREEVGVGTRFDVLRAEVQVANARQDLENANRDRQVAQRTLARRLNVPPSLTITTVPVQVVGNWPLTLEESIVLAYQNRAELEQQLVQSDINEQLARAELAALGPQVDLFATYQVSDILTQAGNLDDDYQFGARLSWTLFEGGAARARARQRELDSEIAERTFEDTRNTVRLAVESAFYNLQSNRTNIDTASLAVEQASEALELANLRFDAGVGTQLDILNAQSELTDAEVNLVQAQVGYNRSLADLERAISNIPEQYYESLPY